MGLVFSEVQKDKKTREASNGLFSADLSFPFPNSQLTSHELGIGKWECISESFFFSRCCLFVFWLNCEIAEIEGTRRGRDFFPPSGKGISW
jgi:hypothetical protein